MFKLSSLRNDDTDFGGFVVVGCVEFEALSGPFHQLALSGKRPNFRFTFGNFGGNMCETEQIKTAETRVSRVSAVLHTECFSQG